MTETDRQILRLAAQFFRHEGPREQVARERFGLRPTAFWARALQLIDRPDVMLAEPALCGQLRRARDARHRTSGRGARRLVA